MKPLAAGSVVGGAIGMAYLLSLRARLPSEPYPPMVRRSLSWASSRPTAGSSSPRSILGRGRCAAIPRR